MEVVVPHRIEFETSEATPIKEIVASLLAAEKFIQELAPVLEDCVAGINIDRIEVRLRTITQESPLKEALAAAIFFTYQKDLEKQIPDLIARLTGWNPEGQEQLVTLIFCVVLFYSFDQANGYIKRTLDKGRTKETLALLVKELSKLMGTTEQHIYAALEKRYKKPRIRELLKWAVAFFKPSTEQRNAPIRIGDRRFDSDIVGETPREHEIEGIFDEQKSTPFYDATIELHATDLDKSKSGWAGVLKGVSDKRVKMELFPPVTPSDLFTKGQVTADVILVSRRGPDGVFTPHTMHVIAVKD